MQLIQYSPPHFQIYQVQDTMEAFDMWLLLIAQHQAAADRRVLLVEAVQEYELQLEWWRLTRPRHYLTCACLDSPSDSAWTKLYRHGSDANFVDVTSVTRRSFEDLVSVFAPHYAMSGRGSLGGRPQKLQTHQEVLGLLLFFYEASLCTAFGIPPATASRTVRRAEIASTTALRSCREARISWPSPKRQVALAKFVAAREPQLQFTFGFIDGKSFKVQEPSASSLQNAMYNGWLNSVLVTGTICFAADGCIIWSRHNCPGSWNDAKTSSGFFSNLLDTNLCPDQRYGVVADSAFSCSSEMVGRILTPLMEGDLDKLSHLVALMRCG